MNRGHNWLFLACLGGALVLTISLCWAQTNAQTQNPPQKKAAEQQAQDSKMTEEEYDAWDKAHNEADAVKKAAALIAFREKYPASEVLKNVVFDYETLMFKFNQDGDFKNLMPVAENWLKYAPNDLRTMGYILVAAEKLGEDKKVAEYGEKIYQQKPSADLALLMYQTYKKLNDKTKLDEWAQKLLEYPEFNDKFELRYEYVSRYANQKSLPKAAEWAQATLKSMALAKKPDSVPAAEWKKAVTGIQKTCYNVIGMNYYEQKKYPEAMQSLMKAEESEVYDLGFYYIGMSQWYLNSIEDAELSFAEAEYVGGEMKAQSTAKLEELHKQLHNGLLIGIERIRNRAKLEVEKVREKQRPGV